MSETVVEKRIYFVRHGETDANTTKRVQGPDEPLNETGLLQAKKLAERAKHIDFDLLVSSDYQRARQTSECIAEASNVQITFSELFRERVGPSQFTNQPNDTKEFLRWLAESEERIKERDWHFADEENYRDIVDRGKRAMEYLESLEEQNVMVVTHGLFLRHLVSTILLGEQMTPNLAFQINKTLKTINTGITVCEFIEGQWRILTWNDHAHFAE